MARGLAVFLVGGLPAIALIVIGVAALVLGGALLLATSVIGSALDVIFRVALYRFAGEGVSADGFADEDMARAFRPKKRRR